MNSFCHENIVTVKQIIREQDEFYYVMEYMDCNLFEYIRNLEKLSEDDVRLFMSRFINRFIS